MSVKEVIPFNPNEGGSEPGGFPVFEQAVTIEQYADLFMNVAPTQFEQWCDIQARDISSAKSRISNGEAIQKALALPPEMQSFATFSLMPEVHNGGVIQWPGIPPEALRKVARENLAPQVIINMRTDDVLRYSTLSTHPWKPGWNIKLRNGFEVPDETAKKDIKDAIRFLENCNIETIDARERDEKQITDFPTYLAELTRDAMTFGPMCVWTDCDLRGRVKAFRSMSAFNIRLCTREGYRGDKNTFAVAVDEAGNIIHQFTRHDLIFRRRNPRPDADVAGYDYPEIEQSIRLIQAFQNAIDMNADVFNRNSTPNGFLTVSGGMNQKQLDTLSRIWMNLKRGVTKQWALPVIPLPKDGEINVVDLSRLKDLDVMYADFMNMIGGLFCAMYRFPVWRLGYHTSGRAHESKPETPTTMVPGIEDHDPYLTVILQGHENLINPYILWTRWPHLQFGFTAKSPKEDAREYEARVLACTVDERRALSDQDPMESLADGEDQKELLKLFGKAPVDPALGGIYQSLITSMFGGQGGEGGQSPKPGARFTSKKDPARAEDHGHASGVRRDSASEAKKAE